jgi:hypothetical protein
MGIRLFPDSLGPDEPFFGLFRQDGRVDMPRPIDWDTGHPIHLVHSDPDHLAYLVAVLVLQAWTTGLDERGGPVPERRPILVVTPRTSRFAEAFLRLHIPATQLVRIPQCRRVRVYRATGKVPRAGEEYWDAWIGSDETRTRFHNFFPSFHLPAPNAGARPVAGRQHLGRLDSKLPAVLVSRPTDDAGLYAIRRQYLPVLEVFDQQRDRLPSIDPGLPRIVFHESIFARTLVEDGVDESAILLPDSTFEKFCSDSELSLVEPPESDALERSFRRLDDALHALDDLRRQGSRVIREVFRTALRLRKILLSIPTGVDLFEQALVLAERPPEFRYGLSVIEPLRNLTSRIPEVAAATSSRSESEWAEYVFSEVVGTLDVVTRLLASDSPKRAAVSAAISGVLDRGRKACVVVDTHSFAHALNWVFRLEPVREGLPAECLRAISVAEIAGLGPDEDCVLHHAFDPNAVFPALARVGPRRIGLVLWRNELRFVGEIFRATARLYVACGPAKRILDPVLDQLDRVAPRAALPGEPRRPSLTAEEFQRVRSLFLETSRGLGEGVVWFERPERDGNAAPQVVQAFLVRLEGDKAFFIESGSRVPYIRGLDDLAEGGPEDLGPGVRLVVVDARARDLIAHKTLDAKRAAEAGEERTRLIERWRREMDEGRRSRGMTYAEMSEAIRRRGSRLTSPQTVGLWARGDALGPLDPEDIWRVGEAVGSQWLSANWRAVAQALRGVRSAHRLFGREITGLIQRVAAGHEELSRDDLGLLDELGVSLAELQDAVSLLTVVDVSDGTTAMPVDQVGVVMHV